MTTATIVTSRPILFSGPMVQSLLSGRKTQTRRIIDYPPFHPTDEGIYQEWVLGNIKSKYGQPGDELWVRETYAPRHPYDLEEEHICYRADLDPETAKLPWGWKPSIFMPRAASRITLAVKNVRVERLQDISEQDAIAEGIERAVTNEYYPVYKDYLLNPPLEVGGWKSPIDSYRTLWDSINGKKEGASWSDNPWVWVVEFEVSK